tara:strand:- start:147 stop:668 length:522 start_codon:yes stop_codon:yes gene_type:complete
MKVVQIYKNGGMGETECKFSNKNILQILSQNSKSRGEESIKLMYSWSMGQCKLLCYGWYDGEAGFENKHDLPPAGKSLFIDCDSSEQLFFGDIFIVKTLKEKYSPLTISEYSDHYNSLFGGFDDCDTDDGDESLDEEEIDEDYSQETGESESEEDEELFSDNENELGEDTTEY